MKTSEIKFVAINVDSNKKRHQHMQQEAEKCQIPLVFFSAITPETISTVQNTYNPIKAQMWWRRALIPTEIACGLSHIALWREFIASSYKYLVVFEDDVHINNDFMAIIDFIQNLPDEKYGFIKLSGQHKRFQRHVSDLPIKDYKLFLNAYGTLDAGCYIINKESAQKLLNYCLPLHMGIDVLMDRSYEHGVDYYTIEPYPVQTYWTTQGDLKSQIGAKDRTLRYDHRNIRLKLLFKVLRVYTSFRKKIAVVLLCLRKI